MKAYLQWGKDLLAIPVFLLLAGRPDIYEQRELLSVLFSVGCLIDALYVSSTWCWTLPWTCASIKDALGTMGMMGFTFLLLAAPHCAPVHHCPSHWDVFFLFAATVDILSVLSVLTPFNIYCREIKFGLGAS